MTPRTRRALDAAREAGIHVIPVTARQPIGVQGVAHDAGFSSWALCSNGSFGVHLETRELLYTVETPVETLKLLASALTEHLPGVVFANVCDAGEGFITQHGYAELATFSDHKRDPRLMVGVPLDEVLARPSLKLVIRHPELLPHEVFTTIQGLGLAGFEVTLSGAPFVEVMAPNVSKASGLARLCAHLGVDASEVLAFGDARNDIEMLTWAGTGVAVANASDEVLGVADDRTEANTDDGVARYLERILSFTF